MVFLISHKALLIFVIIMLVIFAFVMLVLFCPVKYRADGKIESKLNMKLDISWLFRAATFTLMVKDGNVRMKFSILFIKRKLRPKNKDDKKDSSKEKKASHKKEKKLEDKQDVQSESIPQFLISLITKDENRNFIKYVFGRLKKFLKHIGIKRIKTDLTFCLKDPQYTGLATGALSLIPLMYMYDIKIYPNFVDEEYYIRGNFHLRGSIQIFYILVLALSIVSKKQFRQIFSQIRRIRNG